MEEPSMWAGAVDLSLWARGTGWVSNARRIGYLEGSVAMSGSAWLVKALISRVGCKVNITNAVGMAAELLGDV